MRIFLFLLPLLLLFVALAVLLSFLSPWAPVLLLASLLLQAPIVYFIARFNYDSAYAERLYRRKLAFEKEPEASPFLEKEEQEASGFGYRLLSRKHKCENHLIRAELLQKLQRFPEAAALLSELDPSRLDSVQAERYAAACTLRDAQNIETADELSSKP